MARNWNKARQSTARERNTSRVLNWANRMHRLEVMAFEMNAYMVHFTRQQLADREPTAQEKAMLEACEEFRSHILDVLRNVNPTRFGE